jgi:curved DNA-binding protein
MDFKDYYAALGVDRTASKEVIRRAYRKLARKYHPDVSKEPNAQNRFMEVAEAHEALIDPERRAAYDDLAAQHAQAKARGDAGGQGRANRGAHAASPNWGQGYQFSGRGGEQGDPGGEAFSDFFENLFGHARRSETDRRAHAGQGQSVAGEDQHARIDIDLVDAYVGARSSFSLR